MLEKKAKNREQVEFICLENLVPQDHLLRKIDSAVDFDKLYEFVEELYCNDNGRPSIDPVILFKMVLIQHLYGITSLRKVAEEVRANVYYRWFLGYTLNETTPHFSTLSYNFRHRFNSDTVDKIFNWILDEIAEAGYLNAEAVFIDGTHIKANANTKKKIKEEVPVAAKRYAEELLEEINADRESHGKKPFDDEVYEEVTERFPEVETIVADSAYKTPHICKKIFDDGSVLSTAYKRPMIMKDGHEWWKYVYDEYYDCIICPEYQVLKYSTTNRDGYREYKSNPMICQNCPTREKMHKIKILSENSKQTHLERIHRTGGRCKVYS